MENIKTKIQFDGRRKELHVGQTEERDLEADGESVGKGTFETKMVYNEKGIRKLLKNRQEDKTRFEQDIKKAKEKLGEEPTEEDLKELEKHNETQKKLKKIGDYKNSKKDLEMKQEALKEVNKTIYDIKEEIGTRLKL